MATTNNYYQLYVNSVIQLAQTIVIKSVDSAEGLNLYVSELAQAGRANPVDTLDPTSWKYYMNLAGLYHETDTMMTVTSMDTLETIDFTVENLKIHRATAKGYQFGTRQYIELVSRYPQQEMLILGILYPCDIHAAIAAPDGKILSYPPELVEPNEYSLILKLQRFIDGYKERWVNPQYGISDKLYPATHHGIMYLMLVMQIFNIRLAACKTNEAHSYHVRSYLASHQGLDQYLDQMTTKQALFFYRNIAYIERNTGQRATFDWLVEHIMTERTLPLAEYNMLHDISGMPSDIDPAITFYRNPKNLGYNVDSANTITLDQMLNKEQTVARDNALYQPDMQPAILQDMQFARSSSLKTKALESAMIDYSDSTPYTMTDILLNHWLWLSSNGLYTAFVSTTNPKTGERIPLSVKDAWTLMWYCWMGSVGIDLSLQEIPQMYAKRVQRIPMATVTDLLSVVPTKYVDASIAQQALSLQPTIGQVLSTEAFYTLCQEIYTAANMQRNLMAFQEHRDRRGYVMGMVERIYSDNIVNTADPGLSYQDWFKQRNLSTADFSQDDMGLMYLDLVKQATGLALITTNSLANLQAAMVKMLSQLSSYSVQFMKQINTTNIQKVDWPAVRIGDQNTSASADYYIPNNNVRLRHMKAHVSSLEEMPLNGPMFREDFYMHGKQGVDTTIHVKPRIGQHSYIWQARIQSGVRVKPTTKLESNSQGTIPVIGIDLWYNLLPDQKAWFMDVYGDDNYYWTRPKDVPLSTVVVNTNLNGLVWVDTSPPYLVKARDLSGFKDVTS
jgi:hypothetical protein